MTFLVSTLLNFLINIEIQRSTLLKAQYKCPKLYYRIESRIYVVLHIIYIYI